MIAILTVLHIFITVALVGVILIQRSEGGGLGIGGGGGGMSGFMTGRGTANVLTRSTAILAVAFMVSSLLLTWLAAGGRPISLMDSPLTVPVPASQAPAPQAPAPAGAPAAPAPAVPTPTGPSAPVK